MYPGLPVPILFTFEFSISTRAYTAVMCWCFSASILEGWRLYLVKLVAKDSGRNFQTFSSGSWCYFTNRLILSKLAQLLSLSIYFKKIIILEHMADYYWVLFIISLEPMLHGPLYLTSFAYPIYFESLLNVNRVNFWHITGKH